MGRVRPNNSRKDWKFVASDYVPPFDNETYRWFAKASQKFKDACSGAGVEPTKDQARRYKQKKGKAYRWEQEQLQSN